MLFGKGPEQQRFPTFLRGDLSGDFFRGRKPFQIGSWKYAVDRIMIGLNETTKLGDKSLERLPSCDNGALNLLSGRGAYNTPSPLLEPLTKVWYG